MTLSHDDLAGIVDLFGWLSPAELETAVSEIAYRRGEDLDADVDGALAAFVLVTTDGDETTRLAPGPTAFPTLPEGAQDLPHILDIERRAVTTTEFIPATLDRFRERVVLASRFGDSAEIERLLDVSYDLAAWADVDATGLRSHLDEAIQRQ